MNRLPRDFSNYEDVRQVGRSSGSVAANYLKAQEGLSRKEARESGLWLELVSVGPDRTVAVERDRLVREAEELKRISSAIAAKDDTGD